MKKIIIFLFFALLPLSSFSSETVYEEHFIYSIHAYDGTGHKKTFSNEYYDTIYFLADSENIISSRKVFIYFWPPMDRWRIDQTKLNYPLDGAIEITGKKNFKRKLEKVIYSYRRTSSPFNNNSQILMNDTAVEEYDSFKKEEVEYEQALRDFTKARSDFRIWQNDMNKKIRKARDEGKDVLGLVNEVQARIPPYPTRQRPNYSIDKPMEAYYIRLPEGKYKMRLIDDRGDVVEGSEKNIIVFSIGHKNSVGYEYSSRDKILQPRFSKVPSSIIYIDGSNDLFIRLNYQNLFTDFLYNKLSNNDSKGNPGIKRWVKTGIVEFTLMEIKGNMEDLLVEEYFKYEPDPNNQDAYEIVYWDQSDRHRFEGPDFSSFLLPVTPENNVLDLRIKNMNDKYQKGSKRQIRIVRPNRGHMLLLLLGMAPLVIMIVIFVKRKRLYKVTD